MIKTKFDYSAWFKSGERTGIIRTQVPDPAPFFGAEGPFHVTSQDSV